MENRQIRGLARLLTPTATNSPPPSTNSQTSRILDIPINAIVPNRDQPRKVFNPAALTDLAESIKTHGLLQPILVRPLSDSKYEIVAGERRWRAAQEAGITTVRATCKQMDAKTVLLTSLLENLQREDLDPIEEASGYQRMITEWGMKHEEIASAVGKDRATVSNTLRLLALPAQIQAHIVSGHITPGHARALLAVRDTQVQQLLADRIVKDSLSVRQTEKLAYQRSSEEDQAPADRPARPAHLAELERRISERLSVKATIREGKRGGKLTISFSSNAEFMRILDILDIAE